LTEHLCDHLTSWLKRFGSISVVTILGPKSDRLSWVEKSSEHKLEKSRDPRYDRTSIREGGSSECEPEFGLKAWSKIQALLSSPLILSLSMNELIEQKGGLHKATGEKQVPHLVKLKRYGDVGKSANKYQGLNELRDYIGAYLLLHRFSTTWS
jgi:hypothetical protein